MEKLGPRKVMRAPALRRGREIVPLTERVKLERVLGLTVTCNAALDSDPQTSIVAYPAGCVIVLYNIRKNKQSHILSASKKTITSLAFSWDGKYLVTGECGHQPHVRVWDVQEQTQAAEFSGHKYGINCVAFSPNLKYVVSVGTQHDMIVNVWEWKTNVKIASNKVSCKVKAVSFSSTGNYFVTVGNRHVKFWYLEYSRSTKYKLEPVPLMGRSAILGDQRNNYFCDVACGRGEMANSTYAITKSGLLCEFNSRRLLDKWVELRTSSANCISVGEDYIFIGCSEGVVRCFSPFNLHFVCTLPRPHYLGVDVEKGLSGRKLDAQPSGAKFPTAVAISLDEINRKVTCVYNDHSMYIWDVKDVKKVGKLHSFLFHSACIWGVEAYPDIIGNANSILPKGTFLTCSSDDTIRVWNLETTLNPETSYHRNIYSFELLKMLYTDSELAYICDTDFSPSGSSDKVDTYDGKNGVRCLRISPDGQHLAAGDRSGNIRIYDIHHMEELCKIEAHDAEVLCLEYSKPFGEKRYLASASRDRLIHVFDVNQDYELQQTLDDHSSSITAIRFVQHSNQLRMISCAADKSIIFRRAQFTPQLNFSREHHIVGKTTLYDMEVDSQERNVLTACQDRNIRVYSVNGGKYSRCFRGSQGEDGTLIKVVLDPSGKYISTSCTDKSLYIYDFYNEECLASMFGHSELVTGLKFTNCGKHLISVSGDGCIFIWKLPIELTQAILSRQSCLESPHLNSWQENNNNQKINIAITKPIQVVEHNSEDKEFVTSLKLPDNFSKENSPQYRFSMGQLPTWAKKQMLDEISPPSTNSELSLQQTLQPRGRWAQRLEEGGLIVRSYLNSDSIIPFPNMQETLQLEENIPSTTTSNQGNDDSFQISPESIAEINQNGFQEVSSNGHINMCRGSNGTTLHSIKDKQGIIFAHHTDSSSASSLQLEDVEAEDERSDSEIMGSEVVYYPQQDSPEVGDSSFRICATSEDLRITRLKNSKGLSTLPIINTPEHAETNSDDDEPGTPIEGDRTFNILNMSTENLDKLGQREQFMKSNYESLEKNSSGSEMEDDMEEKYSLLPRHSISAKFLARSLQSVRGRSGGVAITKSHSDLQNTARREELNKALCEARKKLETLGWRSGLNSSKSIGDLHNIPDKDLLQLNCSKNQIQNANGSIRKAASLSDLSFASSSQQSFPVSTRMNEPQKTSSPLWDQAKIVNENSGVAHTPKKKSKSLKPIISSSSQKILRSSSMSSLLPMAPIQRQPPPRVYPKSKITSSGISQSMPPLVRTASSSSIISSSRLDSSKLLSSKSYQNNIEFKKPVSDSSSSSEHSPDELKCILPLPPTLSTSRERSLSIGEFAKSKSNIRELRPHSTGLISNHTSLCSKSEWDLSKLSHHSLIKRHSSGKVILEKLDSGRRQHSENNAEINSNHSFTKKKLPVHCGLTDAATIPLTQELCKTVAEELKAITSYAMEIFQRLTVDSELTPSDKSAMTTTLAQGVWQAQQNLRPAMPPIPIWPFVPNSFEHNPFTSPKTSLSVSSHSSDELSADRSLNESVPQQDQLSAMVLLQQYSDRLLSMVEERIGKNN